MRSSGTNATLQLAARAVAIAATVGVHSLISAAAAASPLPTAVGRLAAPLLVGNPVAERSVVLNTAALERAAVASLRRARAQPTTQPQEQERPLPTVLDPESGVVFSILGGSIFSGSSAFQGGAALAYFFGDKASFGLELETNLTFGPGGRLATGLASVVWQLGARTSKFVPYFAGGVGYIYAESKAAEGPQAVLDELGIVPEPETEQGPIVHYGGGLRFYVSSSVAFRGDVRFALVPLHLEIDPGFVNSLYGMSRVAGMLSFNF